jgi:class 3 adenylate cyclase
MDFFRSFIFNRTVLGLLVAACFFVTALDLFIDNSQSRIVQLAALNIARNDVDIIAMMSAPAPSAGQAQAANGSSFIAELNKNLEESGNSMRVELITSGASKDRFHVQAFQEVRKDPKQPFYVLELVGESYILRYAVSSSMFPALKDTPLGAVILTIPMSDFGHLQQKESIKILIVLVALAIISSVSFAIFVGYIRHSAEVLAETKERDLNYQKQLTLAYERFFPHQFLDILQKKNILEIKLGDQIEKRMAVLFSDIRNFTSIIEKKSPAESFKFINDYLGQVGPLVRKNSGFIDKYIGDAIMALYERPDDALNSAIQIMGLLKEAAAKGGSAIEIGAAIHFGNLMVGTVGESERMDGTVISDTVNTSSRLESLNKSYGTHILVSEEFLERLSSKEKYKIRFVDHIFAKGKANGIKIYEVFDVDSPELIQKKEQMKGDFEKAMEHYRARNFQEAASLLENCKKIVPEDLVVDLFSKRCAKYIANPPPGEWSPIAQLSQKDEAE